MSEPTPGERALAMRLGTDADAVGAARDVLNVIASLPWPRPERLSLFARAARTADADVGLVLSGLALDAAPVESFDLLDAIPGLGPKRLTGLIRALSRFDVTALRAEGAKVREAWATAAGLKDAKAAARALIVLFDGAVAGAEVDGPQRARDARWMAKKLLAG